MIKLLVPQLPAASELLPYLNRIDNERWYSNFGPLHKELVKRLENLLGGYVALTSSATTALELALDVQGATPENVRFVPAFTFRATVTAVERVGAYPSFHDVDPETWCMNACAYSVPVCAFGAPLDTDNSSAVIDAASAFGIQGVSDAPVVYSMHATKTFPAGEGGIVLTRDRRFAEEVKRLSNFGFNFSSFEYQTTGSGPGARGGTNAKLSEYHCAVALASLQRWHSRREKYSHLWRVYSRALADITPGITMQRVREHHYSNTMAVLLPKPNAAKIVKMMKLRGVECRQWYECLFPHSTAHDISQRLIGLPMHLYLSETDIRSVVFNLAECLFDTDTD